MTSEAIRPDGTVIREIDPAELKGRLDRGEPLVLVDVREPFEGAIADLPDCGQRRIPVKRIPFATHELDPVDETGLYCRSGPRSAWAAERLIELGFRRVFNLKGGGMAWRSQMDPSLSRY